MEAMDFTNNTIFAPCGAGALSPAPLPTAHAIRGVLSRRILSTFARDR